MSAFVLRYRILWFTVRSSSFFTIIFLILTKAIESSQKVQSCFFVWASWSFGTYLADVDLLYPLTHIHSPAKDSYNTGNYMLWTWKIFTERDLRFTKAAISPAKLPAAWQPDAQVRAIITWGFWLLVMNYRVIIRSNINYTRVVKAFSHHWGH